MARSFSLLTAIVMTDRLLTFAGFIDNSADGKNDASHARKRRRELVEQSHPRAKSFQGREREGGRKKGGDAANEEEEMRTGSTPANYGKIGRST